MRKAVAQRIKMMAEEYCRRQKLIMTKSLYRRLKAHYYKIPHNRRQNII